MGKKSLIKSTSKKKRAPKKAAASKNPKKKLPAKKAAAKAKPVAGTAKKAVPKKAAAASKPTSVKDLLKKQFDVTAPKQLYTVPADKIEKSSFTAPELLKGYSANDAKRIKGLLANNYSEADLKKAAAEKAAAEKAAAEKAAAEKAAAEKAAAEKAAAEKAAAEKAAAEKAEAIKQAAAMKSDVKVSYEPAPAETPLKKPSDPVDNAIKLAAAGLAFLILLVIGASASNSFKYYLTDNQGTLEIWKGKFAPLGKKKLIALPGVPVPDAVKPVYRADDVYPLAFKYYIDEADALLEVGGIPNFAGIKETLKTALAYGSTRELRDIAYARLDNIDRLILTYKADVAASRGTIEDLNAAIGFLEEVRNLTADASQKTIIDRKVAEYEALIEQLEEQAAAEAAAAEAAAAEQAAAEAAAAEALEAEQAEAVLTDQAQADHDQSVAADHAVEAVAEPDTEEAAHH